MLQIVIGKASFLIPCNVTSTIIFVTPLGLMNSLNKSIVLSNIERIVKAKQGKLAKIKTAVQWGLHVISTL